MWNLCQGNYYIAFVILTNALEDYIPSLHYLNLCLNYFYLGLLILCFLLSLGNRPQGAKWTYTLAFVGFGLLTIYMTVRFVKISSVRFVLTLHTSPQPSFLLTRVLRALPSRRVVPSKLKISSRIPSSETLSFRLGLRSDFIPSHRSYLYVYVQYMSC